MKPCKVQWLCSSISQVVVCLYQATSGRPLLCLWNVSSALHLSYLSEESSPKSCCLGMHLSCICVTWPAQSLCVQNIEASVSLLMFLVNSLIYCIYRIICSPCDPRWSHFFSLSSLFDNLEFTDWCYNWTMKKKVHSSEI